MPSRGSSVSVFAAGAGRLRSAVWSGQSLVRRGGGDRRAGCGPLCGPGASLRRAVCRGPGCTLAAAWAVPGAPVSPQAVSGPGGVLPVPWGLCINSTGYWVPARTPCVWGPACPTPGGSNLGPHPGRTRGSIPLHLGPHPAWGPGWACPTSGGAGRVLNGPWGPPGRQARGVTGACPAQAFVLHAGLLES